MVGGVARVMLSLVAGAIFIGGGRAALGWPQYPGPVEQLIVWLIVFIMFGIVMMVIWLPSILSRVADLVAGLFWPSDKNFRIRPEYGVAEARAAQGRWEESIAAFRADIVKFPEESFPHIRIAEILVDRFKDRQGAIAELVTALSKAKSEDSYCLVARRLIDLYLTDRADHEKAHDLLRDIQARYPDTKHAKAAAEMARRLNSED